MDSLDGPSPSPIAALRSACGAFHRKRAPNGIVIVPKTGAHNIAWNPNQRETHIFCVVHSNE